MSRFASGFLTATFLWLAAAAGAWFVWVRPQTTVVVASAPEPEEDVRPEPDKTPRSRPRRRRSGSSSGAHEQDAPANLDRIETRGDELGNPDRRLDLGGSGGEAQLSGAQIEAGMNGAMGSIRRCLVLAAGDEPVHGRVVFGLRIAPTGHVSRVNLRGPRAVTGGECGACLERAGRGARFSAFDGQDMVVHYPLTLE